MDTMWIIYIAMVCLAMLGLLYLEGYDELDEVVVISAILAPFTIMVLAVRAISRKIHTGSFRMD